MRASYGGGCFVELHNNVLLLFAVGSQQNFLSNGHSKELINRTFRPRRPSSAACNLDSNLLENNCERLGIFLVGHMHLAGHTEFPWLEVVYVESIIFIIFIIFIMFIITVPLTYHSWN